MNSSASASRPMHCWTILSIALIIILALGAVLATSARLLISLGASTCGSDCFPLKLVHSTNLTSGVAATLDSPVFTFSPGWQITSQGADPPQPAQPFAEPAGTVSFAYRGQDLYLLLAPGDYWGYLYGTVDGQPANALAAIQGNRNSEHALAGYMTLLAPERTSTSSPEGAEGGSPPRWVLIHRAATAGPHDVRIEFWRGWEQTPLQAVGVDLPSSARADVFTNTPIQVATHWPAVLLWMLSLWLLAFVLWWAFAGRRGQPGWLRSENASGSRSPALSTPEHDARAFGAPAASLPPEPSPVHPIEAPAASLPPEPSPVALVGAQAASLPPEPSPVAPVGAQAASLPPFARRYAVPLIAAGGLVAAALGAATGQWLLCLAGVAILTIAGFFQPTLWLAALLFGLPFAYGVKLPLLPGRMFSLIDLGVFGGIAIFCGTWLLRQWLPTTSEPPPHASSRPEHPAVRFSCLPLLLLALVVSWALVTVFDARYVALALREWRTIFLNALLFGALLAWARQLAVNPDTERQWLVFGWLAGAATMALLGVWGYITGSGELASAAEGVRRVQGLYDSANNLALYLDRTLAVSLALVLFLRSRGERFLWALLTIPQLLAWLLTFSKGSLLLAAPAMLLVLLIGGSWLLRQEQRSRKPLLALVIVLGLGALLLLPFLGADRFQHIFDLGQGTGFLRIQLWRSAWQMALDHPWVGVGPDNFLYAYRSQYLLPSAWQEPNLNHPHNLVLDWWTRLGVPGLVLGLAWLASGITLLWRWLRHGASKALALGCLAAAAAAITHGLIDVSYALPDLMLVWVFLFALPGFNRSMQ